MSCKPWDNEYGFMAQEYANCIQEQCRSCLLTNCPNNRIDAWDTGTAHSRQQCLSCSWGAALCYCSKFFRIILFKAKGPSHTCGIMYRLNPAEMQKFSHCQHLHFQVQRQPWQVRQDVKREGGREDLLRAVQMAQRDFCHGLQCCVNGEWCRLSKNVSWVVSVETIGCF